MDERIKLVVINEHTLGYVIPTTLEFSEGTLLIGILHASTLRGSYYNGMGGSICVNEKNDKIRLASPKDFHTFRVSFDGYNNPTEYEFTN